MAHFTGTSEFEAHEPEVECAEIEPEIWSRLRAALHNAESPLLDHGDIERRLRAHVRGIILQTLHQVAQPTAADTRSPAMMPGTHAGASAGKASAADAVGTLRAAQSIHPAASLAAANALFATAMPVLAARALDGSTAGAEQIAVALHEAINAIVTPASVDYVDVLLDRLSVAHSEERRQVSRDLHDRVAQSMAAAAQRLAMITSRVDGSDDTDAAARPGTDATTLGSSDGAALARDALDLVNESLTETRAIATELRQSVGDRTLYEALSEWAHGLVGAPSCRLTETGVAGRLAPSTREEAFMIVREFIRNARRHSGAERIDVRIDWLPASAEFTVVDDGRGFRTDGIRSGAMGLVAARERSEIIGGSIRIDSEPGAGTRAELTVPVRAA